MEKTKTVLNPRLELAFEFVRHTRKNLFLTGKAGSGKTTFLRQIRAEGFKRLVVVAPTGVAAINAGGVTIHSLFQLPFGIHLPGTSRNQAQQRRFTRKKIDLLRSLDLLVIDEISMVRADLLDAIDDVLRRYRGNFMPFGGVQLLMIGDLHQLPPVTKPEEWSVLAPHYDTPYFFSSKALRQTDYQTIELTHIYRQSDPAFIELLNKVRDNCLDTDALRVLNSRYVPNFEPAQQDGYITLTATNAVAQQINSRNLDRLKSNKQCFRAHIEGEFPASSFPTEECLEFKSGAQVMFIKNDLQTERRYYNGKIGRITRISPDSIYVRCSGDPTDIAVFPDEWQNIRYSLNEETHQIEEQILGTFTQYPIKLAWAITIHKSQGLTFERAIIDAQAAFAHGQVYVALSRCKSFEGIVLRSPIQFASVKTDPVVQTFTEDAEENAPTEAQLLAAMHEFQVSALQELFCFRAIQDGFEKLMGTWSRHLNSLPPQSLEQVQSVAERARLELFDVTENFAPQLAEYLSQPVLIEANEPLQTRIRKASGYFTQKIAPILNDTALLRADTDNRQTTETVTEQLRGIRLGLFVKQACFAACADGFTTAVIQRTTVNAEFEFAKSEAGRSSEHVVIPSDIPNPELYRQLLQWRIQAAERKGRPPNEILPKGTLRELATYLPTSLNRLREMSGIGKARLRQYGQSIVDLIAKYREENQTTASPSITPPRSKPTTSETKRLSFEMFRDGKSIDEIATERRLVRGTIEGHLAHFIAIGDLDVHAVLERKAVDEIKQFLLANPESTSSKAKSHFGEKYSYGELKMVMSHAQNRISNG